MIQANSSTAAETETVGQGIGQVVEDIATLTELQGRLFQSDARELSRRLVPPFAILAAGALLLLAAAPVCLFAIAQCLVAAGLPQAAAYGLVGVAGLAAAAGLVTWAWRKFRACLPHLLARGRKWFITRPGSRMPSKV